MYSESEVCHSCPTLCDPMDCSLPGFSIHGIFQARILEWIAISFSIYICIYMYMYICTYILFFFFFSFHIYCLERNGKDFPGDAEAPVRHPGRGTKTPYASWPKGQNINQKQYCKRKGQKSSMSFLPSQDPGLLAQCSLGDDFSRTDSWVGKAEPEQRSVRLGSVGPQ